MSRPQTPLKCVKKSCRCGENRPESMGRQGSPPCYECICERAGKKRTEGHHPFGRNIPVFADTVVEIPGNWHRVLDARRAERPDILKRPGDNPLHQIASVVVTLGETAHAVADFARRQQWPEWVAQLGDLFSEIAGSAANWLLILAGKLDDKFGPAWSAEFEMPGWRSC